MNKWQFSLESCDVLLYHSPSSYLPVLSYMGQFYIVYLKKKIVQFKTDLAFIIDVIQPQSMYSKLLGHCGCYSFICNVAQKIPAEPTAWFYQLFIYLTIYQSVLFLGKKCTFNDLPRFAADVVIINHKYLDSDVEYEMSYYILFSTWNNCLISLQCYLYDLFMFSVTIRNLFSFTTAVLVFWIKTVLTKLARVLLF